MHRSLKPLISKFLKLREPIVRTVRARQVLRTSAFRHLWKVRRRWWHMLQQPVSHSRRFTSRVETPEGVLVYWRCGGGVTHLKARPVAQP